MLAESHEIFRRSAESLPNWNNLSKNELCFMYVANEGNSTIQNACFGALMCKYWPLINKYHYMCSNVTSAEDVYDWLVDSIQYALKHRRWEDPDSNIYQDPQGPDKVINRRMKCARLTFYQFINRKKRKDDFNMLALEELVTPNGNEPLSISAEENDDTSDLPERMALIDYVRNLFIKKEYFLAFMVDIILNEDVFDKENDRYKFNPKKVAKRLRYINEDYCKIFKSRYHITDNVFECYQKYCRNLSSNLIYNKIEHNLAKLKHDKFFSGE